MIILITLIKHTNISDKLTLILWTVELIVGILNIVCFHVADSILTQKHQIEYHPEKNKLRNPITKFHKVQGTKTNLVIKV